MIGITFSSVPHYRDCSESEFRCKNHKCISGKWRCDYDNDCGDNSDEIECAAITCTSNQFKYNYVSFILLQEDRISLFKC